VRKAIDEHNVKNFLIKPYTQDVFISKVRVALGMVPLKAAA
jgi:hypothetical protein